MREAGPTLIFCSSRSSFSSCVVGIVLVDPVVYVVCVVLVTRV